MAWSWSHTPEAYQDAYLNLNDLEHSTLVEIAAEWRAQAGDGDFVENLFDERVYNEAVKRLSDVPSDVLVEDIWNRASEAATCDNGGWNAWMCPYGCGPHTVKFDRDEL